jgi:hypothetical protein
MQNDLWPTVRKNRLCTLELAHIAVERPDAVDE